MTDTVSAVITTLNEEKLIEECLKSVEWVDEIILVDMYSADRTLEIAKKFSNCKIFLSKDYLNANMNLGFVKASCSWILRIDADERITDELKSEILDVLAHNGYSYDGFFAKYRLFMFGRELKYGVGKHADRQELFRKGYGWYKLKSDHEPLTIKGKWGYLKGKYLHYNYRTIEEFKRKTAYYVTNDARRAQDKKVPLLFFTMWKCIRFFILFYVQRQGFRDGWVGLLASFLRGPYYIWNEDKARRILIKNL